MERLKLEKKQESKTLTRYRKILKTIKNKRVDVWWVCSFTDYKDMKQNYDDYCNVVGCITYEENEIPIQRLTFEEFKMIIDYFIL